MAQSNDPTNPQTEQKPQVDKEELTPEDLDDIGGGMAPAFTREAGPIFVK